MEYQELPTLKNSALETLFDFRLTKGQQKKVEIIKATIDCIAEDGIEKTSFEAIAKRINSQKSHVRYYFKSKDEIFMEMYKYIAGVYQSYSIMHLSKSSSPKDNLNKFLEAYFHWCYENQNQLNVIFLLYHFSFHKKEFRELNQRIREGGVQRITYILKNDLKLSLTPNKLNKMARTIQSIMSQTAMDIYTFKTEDQHREFKEKEGKKIINMLLRQV